MIALRYKIIAFLIFIVFSVTKTYAQIPVVSGDGYYLMDEDGDFYNKEPYQFIGREYSDRHVFFAKGSFGYLSDIGKIAIQPNYDIAYPYKGDFALVGKNKTYFIINKTNQVLDTLTEPKAPKVINKYFLLVNHTDSSEVIFRNAEVVFHTKDSLFLTKNSSFVKWNRSQKKVSFLNTSYYHKKVTSITQKDQIDAVMVSRYGNVILFYQQDGISLFAVVDRAGKNLIVKERSNDIAYKFIRVFGNMVYVPFKSDHVYNEHSDYDFGTKYFWDTDRMFYIETGYKVPFGLWLGSNFIKEGIARIKGSEKYISFSGRQIEGNRLYDNIGTYNNDILPVRIEDQWFLWSQREDTLIPSRYRYIHPIGVQKSTYFGSNTEREWALVNYENGITSEEKYTLPKNNKLYRNNYMSLYEDNANPYEWERNMVRVKEGENYKILNLNGDELLKENRSDLKRIESYVIDLMNFNGRQRPLESDTKRKFKKDKISLRIEKDGNTIAIYLANRTKSAKELGYSGYYHIILEAIDQDGNWKQISKYAPLYGVDYNMGTSVLKNHFIKMQIPAFSGSYATQLRAKYMDENHNYNYSIISNEIDIKLNEAKLWVNQYHHIFGTE